MRTCTVTGVSSALGSEVACTAWYRLARLAQSSMLAVAARACPAGSVAAGWEHREHGAAAGDGVFPDGEHLRRQDGAGGAELVFHGLRHTCVSCC